MEVKNPKKIQLNRLGEQWRPTEAAQDEAVQRKLWVEIWELVLQIYYPYLKSEEELNAMGKVMDAVYEKFQPEKSSLSAYITKFYKLRRIDELRKDKLKPLSLDWETEAETAWIAMQGEEDAQLEAVVEQESFDAILYELSAQILHFAQRHGKKAGNDRRRNYYQLFYTSHLTSYIQMKDVAPIFQHPRDLLAAMKFAFVDFCLEEPDCRTIPAIWKGRLKPYGSVAAVPREKQEQPIPLPIPDKVGLSYLERVEQCPVSKGAYSQMKKHYAEEMEQALQAENLI